MANTFAQHLLTLTANSVKASNDRPQKTPICAASDSQRSATTYASVVLMLAMGTTGANAATDGVTAKNGGTSSASLNLTLTIPERIDVAGLASLELHADRHGGLAGDTSACISGLGSGQYHLSATGSGENGAFEATNGQQSVPYSVAYSDTHGKSQPLTMGKALNRLTGGGANGCAENSPNARLAIRMNNSGANPHAPVSGALTLVIAPE